MKHRATYLSVLFLVLFSAGFCNSLSAQHRLGVSWNQPINEAEIIKQLPLFDSLGIHYLELHHPVSGSLIEETSGYDFSILVRTGHSYFTISDLKNSRSALRSELYQVTSEYRTDFIVSSIELLRNSQVYHSEFNSLFNPVRDTLRLNFNKSFHYFYRDNWYYFGQQTPFGAAFPHKEYSPGDLLRLETFILVQSSTGTTPFFDGRWLSEALAEHPPLKETLAEFSETGEFLLPLPEQTVPAGKLNWTVILLTALWLSVGFHLRYIPSYRAQVHRYFIAHRFFVDDIMKYRERTLLSGMILLVQHALFGGLVSYILSRTFISEAGLNALFHHLPFLALTGDNYFSAFAVGFIGILLTEFIAVMWLYLPCKSMNHLSQVLNLYTGIFHLDFIIVTILVTGYLAGNSPIFILLTGLLFIIAWYAAFNITAIDANRYLQKGKALYLVLTVGLHTAITIVLLLFALNYDELIQVFDLAVHL